MNKQDFSLINGFPMNQAALARMQTAYSLLNALGAISGEKTIITGCVLTGSTVSDGVVYVNGEVFEFKGGVVQTKVIVKEDSTNLIFKNGNSYPVVKTRYVTFGTGVGAMDWVDFKAGYATKDVAAALLGKADKTTFDALANAFAFVYTKMLTIEDYAQKNVKSDWNAASGDAQILNKPLVINYLAKGSYAVGDAISADSLRTISFLDIGTNNYMVVGCMVSLGSNFDEDNDVVWMVREKTNASFKLTLREVSGRTQNLSFEYMLIPL